MNIFSKLKELNLPTGEYVVVGGAMAAHGIRDAHDLDILVTPTLYQKLIGEGWQQCLCDQCLKTSRIMLKKDDVVIVPNFILGKYLGDTKYLIESADIINGFPFVKLEELVKFKRELGRPKDLEDIGLIETYLKQKFI